MPDIDNFKLRPMQNEDMNIILEWRNKAHIRAFMFNDNIIDPKEHEEWFSRTLALENVDYEILEYGNKPVGLANATRIDDNKRSCHWGFYLGESDMPRGTGTIMGTLMIEHIFSHHPVDTIYGEIFEFNTASLKLHEKLGFTKISEPLKKALGNGRQEEVVVFSLCRNDWDNLSNSFINQ